MQAHATNTGMDNRKLAMWSMIGSECMLFGSLIITYLICVSRLKGLEIEGLLRPKDIFSIPLAFVGTVLLILSSLSTMLALSGLKDNDIPRFRQWCLITAILGAAFLGVQIVEYTEFYLMGFGLTASPIASAFYVLTGTHGAHVLVGVLWWLTLWIWSGRTKFAANTHTVQVEVAGLYWHFVDLVWVLIFSIVYLFSQAP